MNKKPQMLVKEQEVAELQKLMAESAAVLLVDYRGITVAQDVELRNRLRKAGIEYRVAKNTLIRIAAHNNECTDLDSFLEGPTSIAFGADPVALCKVFADFARETKKTAAKAGLMDGKFINVDQINELATLPPREMLLARFVGATSGVLRKFVVVMDKVREQKEQQETA